MSTRKLASPLRTWDQEAMSAAYKDVMDDGERVSTAASRFGVPRKSLDDRVKGNVDLDCKMGNETALSGDEEHSIFNYIEYMARRGFPLSMSQILSTAAAIAKEKECAYVRRTSHAT